MFVSLTLGEDLEGLVDYSSSFDEMWFGLNKRKRALL